MSLLLLFMIFAKIGLFGFGGGLAMLPMIFQSMLKYNIMDSSDFANIVAVSQITPGPIIVNAATYVGTKLYGFQGAIVATIGVVIPSFVLMIIAMKFVEKRKNNPIVDSVISGIKPATVGLIFSAVVFIGANVLIVVKPFQLNIIPCCICIGTILIFKKFKINPIFILVIMAIIGGLLCG